MGSRPSMRDGLSELFRRTGVGGQGRPRRREGREVVTGHAYVTTIKVVGVGGGGANAVNRMVDSGIRGVEFIAVNTDTQALAECDADVKMHIGRRSPRASAAGADPDIGRQAARVARPDQTGAQRRRHGVHHGRRGRRHRHRRRAGDRGGRARAGCTDGRHGHPAVLVRGRKRQEQAQDGIHELRAAVDTVIVIPNDRLLQVVERTTTIVEAFRYADDILRQGVQGICDLITVPGLINLDFADVRTIMKEAGTALMGIGSGRGEARADEAARMAISSPLLETSISGARGILLNITGGSDLSLYEVNEAAGEIAHAPTTMPTSSSAPSSTSASRGS